MPRARTSKRSTAAYVKSDHAKRFRETREKVDVFVTKVEAMQEEQLEKYESVVEEILSKNEITFQEICDLCKWNEDYDNFLKIFGDVYKDSLPHRILLRNFESLKLEDIKEVIKALLDPEHVFKKTIKRFEPTHGKRVYLSCDKSQHVITIDIESDLFSLAMNEIHHAAETEEDSE